MTNVLKVRWRGKTYTKAEVHKIGEREKKNVKVDLLEQIGFESIFKTIYTWNTANILWQLIPQKRSSMCKRPIPHNFFVFGTVSSLESDDLKRLEEL